MTGSCGCVILVRASQSLIACHFKGNHYLLLSEAGATQTAREPSSMAGFSGLSSTFPVIPLALNNIGI